MQESNHRWALTAGTSVTFSIFSDIQTLRWQPTSEGAGHSAFQM